MLRIILLLSLLVGGSAYARLEVTVSGGAEGALPIAVVPFGGLSGTTTQGDIAEVIAADLARSGRFAPLARAQMPAEPHTGKEIN